MVRNPPSLQNLIFLRFALLVCWSPIFDDNGFFNSSVNLEPGLVGFFGNILKKYYVSFFLRFLYQKPKVDLPNTVDNVVGEGYKSLVGNGIFGAFFFMTRYFEDCCLVV